MTQLYQDLLVSSSTPSLFHAALAIRLWGGIVNSLAFIPTLTFQVECGASADLAKFSLCEFSRLYLDI